MCTLEANRVNVRSFQGTIKHTLALTESEGAGADLRVQGKFLVASTRNNYVKIWDMSKREPRSVCEIYVIWESNVIYQWLFFH